MSENRKLLLEQEIKTRWGDMDAIGHVNNATYFTYLEQVRVSWVDSLAEGTGSVTSAATSGPVLINASCTFLKPVVHPARLLVRMFGGVPGRSSFETTYEIRDADDLAVLYATASAKVVWVDYSANRSTPLPERLRALLPAAE